MTMNVVLSIDEMIRVGATNAIVLAIARELSNTRLRACGGNHAKISVREVQKEALFNAAMQLYARRTVRKAIRELSEENMLIRREFVDKTFTKHVKYEILQ